MRLCRGVKFIIHCCADEHLKTVRNVNFLFPDHKCHPGLSTATKTSQFDHLELFLRKLIQYYNF